MDLSDDERAALQAALEAWYASDDPNSVSGEAIWRAAGRYYLEMAAKICDTIQLTGEDRNGQIHEVCAKAIRNRLPP